jgi:ABC-type uncharacterized transport system substrate-binding protein
MKIAILHNGLNDISFVLSILSEALVGLGHEVVYIKVSTEKEVIYQLIQTKSDAIFGYKFYRSELINKLYKIASYLKIPVIDHKYCYRNLSLLLNSHRNSYASNLAYINKRIAIGGKS